jgi:hypothetical protein
MLYPMNPTRYSFSGRYADRDVTVAYGCDPVIGYWVDVFDADEEPLLERSTLFDGLYHGAMVELLTVLGCPNMDHLNAATLDLPF